MAASKAVSNPDSRGASVRAFRRGQLGPSLLRSRWDGMQPSFIYRVVSGGSIEEPALQGLGYGAANSLPDGSALDGPDRGLLLLPSARSSVGSIDDYIGNEQN